MPYYRFHLNVPAETTVVAERLRSLIGQRCDSWIDPDSPPPFFGKMKHNSFRIRRNIGSHRNSFLPRILGRITPVWAGTRVKVTMRMNPVVLAIMLFWLTGVGFAAWASLRANPEYFPIPLLMLMGGLCLSFGSFYWEAIKARTLLSNAATQVSPLPAQVVYFADSDAFKSGKKYRRFVLAIMAALTLTPTALTLHHLRKALTDCPAFRQSLAIAAKSPAVRRALGDHVEMAGFTRGFV